MSSCIARLCCLAVSLAIAGCSSSVYLRDGVTDGDTFFLAPRALADNDPVLQSWVTYSLIRSTCQLEVGGENPARVSTYDCELRARRNLLDAWQENRKGPDPYLDTLLAVSRAGFLEEYVAYYFGKDGWQVPSDVDMDSFQEWRRTTLKRHKPETHLVGSWGYRRVASHTSNAVD
ncbi:MAG TPA: hypothetical protein VFV10_04815 [Gammaproteobacteria bacterium]|nr:hypothetical protein [Gammaproteobacteria bacterium]